MVELTRRAFARGAALTLAGAGTFARHAAAEPYGLPIGLQLYTVGDDLRKDFEGTMKAIARIGYRQIEGNLSVAGKTPKEALQKKYEKLQKDAAELQSLLVNYQQEMQHKEQELTTPILQKVLGIVKRIATQEGYDAVLMKDAAPYYRSDLEITDKTIQMYNQQGGGAGAATPNPAPGKSTPAPAAPKKK